MSTKNCISSYIIKYYAYLSDEVQDFFDAGGHSIGLANELHYTLCALGSWV